MQRTQSEKPTIDGLRSLQPLKAYQLSGKFEVDLVYAEFDTRDSCLAFIQQARSKGLYKSVFVADRAPSDNGTYLRASGNAHCAEQIINALALHYQLPNVPAATLYDSEPAKEYLRALEEESAALTKDIPGAVSITVSETFGYSGDSQYDRIHLVFQDREACISFYQQFFMPGGRHTLCVADRDNDNPAAISFRSTYPHHALETLEAMREHCGMSKVNLNK